MASKRENGIFISASVLRDYLKCSQMAYYRIFEPELKVDNREMIIGNIVHKTIEKAWQNIDVALNLGMSLADKDGVDAIGNQYIVHCIHTFFENFAQLITKEDKVEKFFKIKLEDDVYLVGKLDRVSRGIIFDWKTNSKVPKTIENDPQFIIYNHAYNLIYNKPPEGIYFASLNTGGLVRYTESKEHTTTLLEKVIPQYVDDVKKKNFIKQGLFNGSCYRCPFKTPCLGERSVLVFSEPAQE